MEAEERETNNQTDDESLEIIKALADSLLHKRDAAVEFRDASGIEARWLQDEKIFDGLDPENPDPSMLDYATGRAYVSADGPKRSKVVVNIVRAKCETAEGRFSDIQLPTDDKNWGLKVTPIPIITEGLKVDKPATQGGRPLAKPDGSPMLVSDVARSDKSKATDKMKAMESEIDDQLTECNFNAECRKVIRAAVRSGTGILKGPNIVKTIRKAWTPDESGTQILQIQEEMKPASKWADHWNVYPDPECEEDITRAAYIWERDTILPRELRLLLGVDGYFNDQIEEVLREEPKRLSVVYEKKSNKRRVQQITTAIGSHLEKWEYYGELNRDDLLVLNIDLSHDDVSKSFSVCVVFVNDRPIKVQLNALDTGDMPYDFFQWTTKPGSPWGIGVPNMLRWLQRIMTAAWRAMMDNLGDSSGANIIIGAGLMPDDGRFEITGKKIWRALEDDVDVRSLFNQFQILNNQKELQAVIDLTSKYIDMETSLPTLFQGEKGGAPETFGATEIMVDANNVALRSRVKLYDDQITRPHITRYYHWNMQYNPKPEIKGDFNVDARGTSVLLEKDQQAEVLMKIMAAKKDPDFNLLVDWEKATKQILSSARLDVLKSDEDLTRAKQERANNPPPQDPRIATAQIRSQAELEKAKMISEANAQEVQIKNKIHGLELKMKLEEAERGRQHDIEMERMRVNFKMMELSQAQNITLDQIKAGLMESSMTLKTKAAGDKAKMDLQRELSAGGKAAPEVLSPPTEPPGRAADGRSFPD